MKIQNIVFAVLIIYSTDINCQTIQSFAPPQRNWTYFNVIGSQWESYDFGASIKQLNKSKIIYGNIDHSSGSSHSGGGILTPYYFKIDQSSQPVTTYPDSGSYNSGVTYSNKNEFTNFFLPDQSDNLFIVSSKFSVGYGDGADTYYASSTVNIMKETSGIINTLAHWNNAGHPCALIDQGDTVRMVWEEITFLTSRTSSYTSNIYYNTVSGNVLGQKILIGKGFYPQIKKGYDNKIHVLWYDSDSMSVSTIYNAKQCTIEAGVLNPIDCLHTFTVLTGTTMGHPFVARFYPPAQWSVSNTGEVELVWQEDSGIINVGRYSKPGTMHIAQSNSYSQYGIQYLYPFFNADGEIILTWAANQSLYYAKSKSNDIFANIYRLPVSADYYGSNTAVVPVLDNSKNIVCFFLNPNNNYILNNFPENSIFHEILKNQTISSGLSIDNQNNVWCVSSITKPAVISFSLSDPLLEVRHSSDELNPVSFSLSQNYPNPFNPSTTIDFTISLTSHTTLELFDVLGNIVEVLVSKDLAPASYSINWNAAKYTSGVYFYRLQSGNFTQTRKLLLVK